MADHPEHLPDRLHRLRRQRGLTQAELAARARLNQRYISALENGLWARRREHVRRLARALGVRVDRLLGGTGVDSAAA